MELIWQEPMRKRLGDCESGYTLTRVYLTV